MKAGIFIPDHVVHMYFGDQIVVNGKISPFMNVSRRLYSFRIVGLGPDETFVLSFGPLLNMTLTSGVQVESLRVSTGEMFQIQVNFAVLPHDVSSIVLICLARPERRFVMQFRVSNVPGRSSLTPFIMARPSSQVLKSPTLPIVFRNFTLSTTAAQNKSMINWMSINNLGFEDLTEFVRKGSVEVWTFVNLAMMKVCSILLNVFFFYPFFSLFF